MRENYRNSRFAELADHTKKWVLSDLDLAGLTAGGKKIDGELFNKFVRGFNTSYGPTGNKAIIQHEPLAHADIGVWADLTKKRGVDGVLDMLREPVTVFNKSGFVESLSFVEYWAKYIKVNP